jgi:hypothetical protein
MMKEKFEKEGLSTIRDSFTYRNLSGKQVRCGGGIRVRVNTMACQSPIL